MPSRGVESLVADERRSQDGESGPDRLPLEPMDPRLTWIQPGGGVIVRLELAWGRWRRWFLKTFRRTYVARMRDLRQGARNGCPHEVLDPRDLKFHRNQDGYWWAAQDDPFRWRDRLPFARAGLAELLVLSLLFFGTAGVLGWVVAARGGTGSAAVLGWTAVAVSAALGALVVWFFRNPRRQIPQDAGLVVSPADGKVVEVREIEHDEFIGGPALMVGVFLSLLNVHTNRMPVGCRVIGLRYRPGKCLNAMRPEASRENEQLEIRIEDNAPPHRRLILRQITGAVARRIVCWLKPGDELERGQEFGMIKLGSRAELVLPREPGLELRVQIGDKIRAGATVVARYS
ncbi:MAG TPA: phosphatidylserine decarboxylase family protein [Planctomycetaceae bacterium]|nr:phosphatidylserine decarboxylase family protein [Planctomycetaceae bacterium]